MINEFFKILGLKKLIVILLGLILIRLSILYPICNNIHTIPLIDFAYYLMFCLGMVFIFASNNVAEQFFDTKLPISQSLLRESKAFVIKDYPDLYRMQKLYISLALIGLISTIYVGIKYHNTYVIILSCLLCFLGYMYSYNAKRRLIIGNICFAICHSLILIIPMCLDFYPMVNSLVDKETFFNIAPSINIITISTIILSFMIFILSLLWDITSDLTNLNEDKQKGYKTFAVCFGEKHTKLILTLLTLILIGLSLTYISFNFLHIEQIQIGIIVLIFILPLLYYMYALFKAKQNTDYNFLYTFLGMLFISLLFIVSFIRYFFSNGLLQ